MQETLLRKNQPKVNNLALRTGGGAWSQEMDGENSKMVPGIPVK